MNPRASARTSRAPGVFRPNLSKSTPALVPDAGPMFRPLSSLAAAVPVAATATAVVEAPAVPAVTTTRYRRRRTTTAATPGTLSIPPPVRRERAHAPDVGPMYWMPSPVEMISVTVAPWYRGTCDDKVGVHYIWR